jgi:hypothetical protein
MGEDVRSLIQGGSDLRTLYAQDKFNLCREISVLEGTTRPRVPINVLPPEYSGKLLLTRAPQVIYRQLLLRTLTALIKEFFVLLRALFQISPCTFYSQVSYITLPPPPLHRTKNRLHARVTTGIHPEGGRSHESYKGPSWRT